VTAWERYVPLALQFFSILNDFFYVIAISPGERFFVVNCRISSKKRVAEKQMNL
jgi:hypothetical protein